MIKGCHKSIVFLKNTDSEFFDEAYFVLKPNAVCKKDSDIVLEANKIVSSLTESKKRTGKVKGRIISFFLGGIIGASLTLLLTLII